MTTGRDRGVATVMAVLLVQVLVIAALGGSVVAAVALAHARASAVADLAALSGAQAWGEGCGAAAVVASANGMTLGSCTADGQDVRVEVIAPLPQAAIRAVRLLGASLPEIRAAARAGPASG